MNLYEIVQSTTSVLLGIRENLIRAMKRGEVTMMVMADYSKVFDTVRCKSVFKKMHVKEFSKSFLKWMLDYIVSLRTKTVYLDRYKKV